ncbi:MAG: 50S ribosomal protein L14e [Candidatus Nanoarchaeia archaeon]|nr:50S ribosomal protein L14e [Candidatus Nanoarchaeia archaeon]
MFELGRLCVKIAGRDAGLKCVVVDVVDDSYVMIDGQTRRRKCNIKHLEPTDKILSVKKGASHEDILKELDKEGIKVKEKKKRSKKAKTETVKEEKPKAKEVQEKKAEPKAEKKTEAKPKKTKAKKAPAKKAVKAKKTTGKSKSKTVKK